MSVVKKKANKKKVPRTVPRFVQIAVCGALDSIFLYGLDKDGRIWSLEDEGDPEGGWERTPINIYVERLR